MAIAYDASSNGYTAGATSLTVSHTCSGSNRVLIVGVANNNGDNITGVTYNGVSMTQVVKKTDGLGNNNYLYLYQLAAPATGANNIVVSRSSSGQFAMCAASYVGVEQTSPIDTSASTTNASTTSITESVTTTTNNCWTVAYCGIQRSVTASTNTTSRATDSHWGSMLGDSNGAITPAGSFSMTQTFSSITVGGQIGVILAIKPYVASGPANLKSLNTNVKANIKSYNTNVIANVKSVNTNS